MQNCPRMKKHDFLEFRDHKASSHNSESSCKARAQSWHKSCNRDTTDEKRFVKARYLTEQAESSAVLSGNGCVITASFCLRMGFTAYQSKLDSRDKSHKFVNSCMKRAGAYLNSCSKNLKKGEMHYEIEVKATFLQDGKIIKENLVRK